MKAKMAAGEAVWMSAGPCVATVVAESGKVARNWLFSRLTGGMRWNDSVIVAGRGKKGVYDYGVG